MPTAIKSQPPGVKYELHASDRLGESLSQRMRKRGLRAFQNMLTRIGAHCSAKLIHQLESVVGYLETGRWMRAHGFSVAKRYQRDEDIWAVIAPEVENERVLYLEFGVFRGYSIRHWAKHILKNPASTLHGFDSFEGLPEDWTLAKGKGHFSTGGALPVVDDSRIRFCKGWFNETLPKYEWPDRSTYDRLIVNLDADLYESTRFVLEQIESRIEPGTFLYFDEFNDHDHELKAFDEFIKRTGMKFRLRAAKTEFGGVIFERVAESAYGTISPL